MGKVLYREAQFGDIPAMAEIRAGDWGTEEYWRERISRYLTGEVQPKEALGLCSAFVAVEGEHVAGLIVGHLTCRFGCDGELEWISVRREERNRGIASGLLGRLAEWFLAHNARRVCVD